MDSGDKSGDPMRLIAQHTRDLVNDALDPWTLYGLRTLNDDKFPFSAIKITRRIGDEIFAKGTVIEVIGNDPDGDVRLYLCRVGLKLFKISNGSRCWRII